ncbi:isopentenyl-diphosphate Delta-isomerase [Pseudomonas sp. ZM23]|uniref:Isopentenyl-diphosphate Delta-isomerase n=1 Tax=Pseudomonas triclosanedens TaxID=2961893 RepID=A0ABY6ZVV8_9PSED|nr:isopentenyl-diphosphate Delta-isomerase [Pseudomonas triclosanedens]MCP8465317.1 isopentenyl-diphosphate Delta-isomerase [Pseudomonas triclosanedens]MCP8470743.1 isopentenyl-diphosphate Delta-isomerase [Pseudomonas triclosanedens]MCP8476616.1 isopentenyl-diphosphate Delta-isomerase [Pseudomonas triclosanedens]WAI48929.1 isopentenyl-diphosphate Delta-isomerase [Pseudomonas triclosanedens]
MTDIQVILVDEHDNPTGTMEKLQAHHLGQRHRAISVYLFNRAGELLLQRRAQGKYHCGGLWSNSCCGHPYPDESAQAAAQRRLFEEMGVRATLRKLFEFSYCLELPGGMTENEYGHIFGAVDDQPPHPDPEEADDFRYIALADLEAELAAQPERFTPWFRLCYPALRQHLRDHGELAALEA